MTLGEVGYRKLATRISGSDDWMEDARCRLKSIDPDIFFNEPTSSARGVLSHSEKQAKACCLQCPVRKDCLIYGLRQTEGIWGGVTKDERAEARKKFRGNAPAQVATLELLILDQAESQGLCKREEVIGG